VGGKPDAYNMEAKGSGNNKDRGVNCQAVQRKKSSHELGNMLDLPATLFLVTLRTEMVEEIRLL
jgi:hypothetical protein